MRRIALALALGATLAGGAALAHVPASAQHAPVAAAVGHGAVARVALGNCPSTTLICP